MKFRRIGEKPPRYDFVDALCIGRRCFHAGLYNGRPCCMNRACHGCPPGPVGERKDGDSITVGLPVYDKRLAAERKAQGWRQA